LISLSNNKEFIIFWSRGVKQGSTWTNKNILILGKDSNLTTIGSFYHDCTQTCWELSNNTKAQQKGGEFERSQHDEHTKQTYSLPQ
jgi:hypothetical protein